MKIMKSKKAVSLIEIVVVMGAASIITMSIMKCTISGIVQYTREIEELIKEDSLDNALLNLDNLCNGTLIAGLSCSEADNTISIKYINEINSQFYNKKIISFSNNKIRVKTINNDNGYITEGENILIAKVSEFKVQQKGKLIYYKIKLINGAERIRCI